MAPVILHLVYFYIKLTEDPILFGNMLQKLSQNILLVNVLKANKWMHKRGRAMYLTCSEHTEGDLVKFKAITGLPFINQRTMQGGQWAPIIDRCLSLPPKRLNP